MNRKSKGERFQRFRVAVFASMKFKRPPPPRSNRLIKWRSFENLGFNRGRWKNEKEGTKSKRDSFFFFFLREKNVVHFACNYRFSVLNFYYIPTYRGNLILLVGELI